MNKILIFLFILLPLISFSQEEADKGVRIQGSKELPLELNLLIQSLQESNLAQDELLNTVYKIDSYAKFLTKEDIFLVGKIEIYKTLLKSNAPRTAFSLDGDTIKLLKDALKKAHDPFVKWFLQALLHDSDSILSSSLFKDYTFQKNNGKLEKLEYRKIDKKIQLLGRWISIIRPENPDFENTLKAELVPVMIEALKNIEQSYVLLAQNSAPGKISVATNIKDLKFFGQQARKPVKKAAAQKEKSVEDILAPITEENAPTEATLPEPSKEDWLIDDNAPANLKNLPKPSDDADWLQDI